MVVPGQHWSQDTVKEFERRIRAGGIPAHVAKDMGLPVGRPVFTRARAIQAQMASETKPVTFPDFVADGDEEEPIDEVIARMERNFTRAKTARDKKKWFRIGMPNDKPVGILFVGDPHVDDDGCNWPLLRHHANLCATTPGLYGVNIGDTTNCWGGRLVRLYANQDASVKTARRLAEWLMLDSGIRWLLWLLGNHEHMGDGGPLLAEMNKRHGTNAIPLLDWQADFILAFPGGAEFKVSCAHDFPGNSMWNPNHGAVKAARFGANIDLLVHGHLHNWAISQWELAEQGSAPLMVRTRGYKHLDPHATRIGAHEQEEGQSILVIFDPAAKSRAGRVQAFVDIDRGAEYLRFLRGE